ncbi:Glutamate decarboxylase [Mycena kentingensis (nom. inval.)]|nr:Glutamate decarboxylase [Mycena kentingensis (nom. inval.)]
MSLSRHINADDVIQSCKDHKHRKHAGQDGRQTQFQSWSRDEDAASVPKYSIPEVGINSKAAYQLLHDETALDGNPLLNLASFVHTWMPEEANKLIMENINKNQVDLDEYPAATIIHNRCISMLADLWKAPKDCKAIGTSTAGSSEAIMLGGLAMKKRWQEARKAAGKDHYHPNIVFGSNAQVALEKFARYWDVEARLVPVNAKTNYVMNPRDAMQYIDENTIGVMVIMGSTYTGHFEDVQLMSDLLDDLQKRTGLDIPIHVDGASGAFIAPFAYPQLKWAFDIPRVVSINTSGHKFGLVYAGLGWILWRDESYLHKDLIFELHYLGSVEYSFTLNFSKPAAPIIAQMYNFLNLGKEGYRRIATKDLRNARMLSRALEATYFTILSNVHKPVKDLASVDDTDNPELYEPGLPVVSFRLSDKFAGEYPHVQQAWIQSMLRTKGWIVPNYNAPEGEAETQILRVVVRETLSEDLVERLIVDILEITEGLMGTSSRFIDPGHAGEGVVARLRPSFAFGPLPSHATYSRVPGFVLPSPTTTSATSSTPSLQSISISTKPPPPSLLRLRTRVPRAMGMSVSRSHSGSGPLSRSLSVSIPPSPLSPVAKHEHEDGGGETGVGNNTAAAPTLPIRLAHALVLPFTFLFHLLVYIYLLPSFFTSKKPSPSSPPPYSHTSNAFMLPNTVAVANRPDKEHGRPDAANFANGNADAQGQAGFARQC